jgi:hypothetical protein
MLITDDVVPPETSPKILPSSVPSLWGYSPYHRARLRLRSYRLAIPDNLIYPWCHWGHTIREGADLPPRPPKYFLTCLPLNFQKIEVPENRFVFFASYKDEEDGSGPVPMKTEAASKHRRIIDIAAILRCA